MNVPKGRVYDQDMPCIPAAVRLDNRVVRRRGSSILFFKRRRYVKKPGCSRQPTPEEQEIICGNGNRAKTVLSETILTHLSNKDVLRKLLEDEDRLSAFRIQAWHRHREKGGNKSLISFIDYFDKILKQKKEEFGL